MKKEVLFVLVFLFLFVSVSFIVSADDANVTVSDDDDSDSESAKIDLAFQCLEDKLDDKCDDISSEERIFALMATGECKSEVLDDSRNDEECWPKSGCKIKTTAQAILALDEVGTSTDDAEEWLFEQNETPEDMIWYLQIESADATTCTIGYSSSSYSVVITDNKKLSSGAGSCLSLSEGAYWLKVNPTCLDEEFQISCDQGFLTNLLYKRKDSSTIYVSEKTHSASSEGTTTEKINSFCFGLGECDYEGTLWAALVLDYEGYDVSPYMPYLIAMSGDNEEFLPEAFIYAITGYDDFRTDLLLKQTGTFWDESGEKFYDTALALLPFQDEEPQEKSDAKEWLLEVQDKDGCWKGNLRDTAFILYSVWQKNLNDDSSSTKKSCEDVGKYCMSEVSCEGEILDYDCDFPSKCCSVEISLDSCSEQAGEICDSDEICSGGVTSEASDLSFGESCCVGGSCAIPQQESECEQNFGVCRSYGCDSDEIETGDSCDDSTLTCCVIDDTPEKNYFWIWFFLILIILVAVAIFFRDKLRVFWFKIKSKFDKGKSGPSSSGSPGGPRGLPPPGMMPMRRPMQRRPPMRRPVGRPMPGRTSPQQNGELDSVLKKLKEMSK